jgi:CBS domain-containing protein
MHIAVVLKRKGSDVVSIAPDRTIAEAVNLLAGPAPRRVRACSRTERAALC